MLTTTLEYKNWKDQVFIRSSRRRSGEPDHTRPAAPIDRKPRKDPRADNEKTTDGTKRKSGDNTKAAAPRAGGGTEPGTPSPSRKPASEDPFKIYTRKERRAHYEKMKEERSLKAAGAGQGAEEKAVRAAELTELPQQPPLLSRIRPTSRSRRCRTSATHVSPALRARSTPSFSQPPSSSKAGSSPQQEDRRDREAVLCVSV